MNKRVALLAALMLLAIGWVVFSFQPSLRPAAPDAPGAQAVPTGGKLVENFALPDDAGNTVQLSDYKGKAIALVFYASW